MILITTPIASLRNLERVLAAAGAAVCLVVSVRTWLLLRAVQPMWPLPDLYLLETAAAGMAGGWAVLSSAPRQAALRGMLIWITIGLLMTFVILGALSIGFEYAPAALLFVIAAVASDRRQSQNSGIHLGIGLLAALAQAALMLTVVQSPAPFDARAAVAQSVRVPNQTLAPCLVTQPNGKTPPGENPSTSYYGNGSLWTDLQPDGKVVFLASQQANVKADGSLFLNWPWWHDPAGKLTIEGRRLDAPAAPLHAEIPPRVDVSSFEMSVLTFPTPGCWEITGSEGQASLTFVTQVIYNRQP
jgi:hypothetical protein